MGMESAELSERSRRAWPRQRLRDSAVSSVSRSAGEGRSGQGCRGEKGDRGLPSEAQMDLSGGREEEKKSRKWSFIIATSGLLYP